jgi:putative copper resistance protein D
MPGYAQKLSTDERWDLVNWVRTMPLGGLGDGLMPQVVATAAVPAPNFIIEIAGGQEDALRSRLTRGPLLLVLFTLPSSQSRLEQLDTARAALAEAGLEILALPFADDGGAAIERTLSFVARADPSVVQAYRLIATLRRDRDLQLPIHLEFLIDGNGYLRGQWQSSADRGWDDMATLLHQVQLLAGRSFAPVAARRHVH